MAFDSFFRTASNHEPYPYQRRLGTESICTRILNIPTGCGKTAAAILAWLWQRRVDPNRTPRRLVYCLPMRVLVEQTRDCAGRWIKYLRKEGTLYCDVSVYTLMGCELQEDWELCPDKPAILVGTQDMLRS